MKSKYPTVSGEGGITSLFTTLKIARLLRVSRVARKLDQFAHYSSVMLLLVGMKNIIIISYSWDYIHRENCALHETDYNWVTYTEIQFLMSLSAYFCLLKLVWSLKLVWNWYLNDSLAKWTLTFYTKTWIRCKNKTSKIWMKVTKCNIYYHVIFMFLHGSSVGCNRTRINIQ